MNDRDYVQLFEYFVGARGNHAVHVRSLIHAGFDVDPDPNTLKKSYVKLPTTGETIGVILGEPDAVIGKYVPTPTPVNMNGKVAGRKILGSGV